MSNSSHPLVTGATFPITGGDLIPGTGLPLSLEINTVEQPQRTDEMLGRAVNRLIPAALERRQGILVIQRDYGKYTVRVDPEVPCGTIQESRL